MMIHLIKTNRHSEIFLATIVNGLKNQTQEFLNSEEIPIPIDAYIDGKSCILGHVFVDGQLKNLPQVGDSYHCFLNLFMTKN